MADVSKRLERAEKYLQKDRTDLAAAEYLQAVAEDPGNWTVRQTAADLLLSLDKTAEASQHLTRIFEHYIETGDSAKAIVNYKKLAKIGASTAPQTLRYAQLIERSSKREAVDAYNKVVDSCTHSGRMSDALTVLRRIVTIDPTPENFQRVATLAEQSGFAEEAADALVNVAQLEEKNGRPALGWYSRAHKLNKMNGPAALGYAKALMSSRKPGDAADILKPIAAREDALFQVRETYGRALLDAGRYMEAEPFLWRLFETDPKAIHQMARLLGGLLDAGTFSEAVALARKLEAHQTKAGLRREFVNLVKGIADEHPLNVEFLEFLAEMFNTSNREMDYCVMLLRLYEVHFNAGDYARAAECFERAVEVDAYEPGHSKRLETLRGKISTVKYKAIEARLVSVIGTPVAKNETVAEPEAESTNLEDLVLQAEIYLRYGMREKAIERLVRLRQLYPGEEQNSAKLQDLLMDAGLMPETMPRSPASQQPLPPKKTVVPAHERPVERIPDLTAITDISRKLAKQTTPKNVLFAAVEEIARHFRTSRCVAALGTPGKPPSATLEFVDQDTTKAQVVPLVKLITTVQNIVAKQGALSVVQVAAASELNSIREELSNMRTQSLLALPLQDGEKQAGIIILEQSVVRNWTENETLMLRTIADQVTLAVNSARLRSLVKDLALTEEKSGLLRRTSYIDALMSEIKRAGQHQTPVTVLLMNFGRANKMVKNYSEAAVQRMMQEIGQGACSHIRQHDVAVRYGLTDIALVLAETDEKTANFVVDKMRRVLSTVHLPGTTTPVTFCAGIAEAVLYPGYDAADIVTELINRAEAALQIAIHGGGNRVEALQCRFQRAAMAS